MIVVLNDWPFGPQVVDSWVREQLISLGLDPDGADNAQVWGGAMIHADSERTTEVEHMSHVGGNETHTHQIPEWPVAYILEGFVEYTDPQFGTHTTLYTCPCCYRLTAQSVCPHCGADIISDAPKAEYQSSEDIEAWFGADTPGMVVQFRCELCGQFFGVEGAIRHAQETGHKKFHRA